MSVCPLGVSYQITLTHQNDEGLNLRILISRRRCTLRVGTLSEIRVTATTTLRERFQSIYGNLSSFVPSDPEAAAHAEKVRSTFELMLRGDNTIPLEAPIIVTIEDNSGTVRVDGDAHTLAKHCKATYVRRCLVDDISLGFQLPRSECEECLKQQHPTNWFAVPYQEYRDLSNRSASWGCVQCPNTWYCDIHGPQHKDTHNHAMIRLETYVPPQGETLRETMLDAFTRFATRPFLSEWKDHCLAPFLTYSDMLKRIVSLCNAMPDVFRPGAMVGIQLPDGIDWVVCDFACALSGAVSVAVESDVVREHFQKKLGIEFTHVFTSVPQGSESTEHQLTIMDTKGNDLVDLFGLLPSSGTTGLPKLLKYTRATWLDRVRSIDPEDAVAFTVNISYAPLTHFSARFGSWRCLFDGAQRVFTHPSNLLEAIRGVNPTSVSLVPSLWDRIRLMHHGDGEEGDNTLIPEDIVGQRCVAVSTGSAPVSDKTLWWLHDTFGERYTVINGYGSSEVGTIALNNSLKLDPDHVRIDNDNVLWVKKGKGVFDGYYGEENGDHLDSDGFFCTNDVVEYDPGTDRITIVGRSGDIIKLSNGLFVHPDKIERVCAGVAGVASVCALVVDDYVLLLVLPVKDFEKELNQQTLLSACQNAASVYGPQNTPIGLLWAREDFTPENGQRTASMKLRRRVILDSYQNEVAQEKARIRKVWEDVVFLATGSNNTLQADSITTVLIQSKLSQQLGTTAAVSLTQSRLLSSSTMLRDHLSLYPMVVESATLTLNPMDRQSNTLVLTGATGLVGCHVLIEALQSNLFHSIWCLVRGENPFDRLQSVIQSYGFNKELLKEDTVHAVSLLGQLPEEIGVDAVIDCAAEVDMLKPYDVLYESNVHNAVRLREKYRSVKHYVFVSTSSVEGIDDAQRIYETSGYVSSKYVAERAVNAVAPTIIQRLGFVVFNMQHGRGNPHDLYHRITASLRALQCAPLESQSCWKPVIPADICGQTILKTIIASSPETVRVLHRVAPTHRLHLQDVVAVLGLQYVQTSIWRQKVQQAIQTLPGGFPLAPVVSLWKTDEEYRRMSFWMRHDDDDYSVRLPSFPLEVLTKNLL